MLKALVIGVIIVLIFIFMFSDADHFDDDF